MGFGGFSWKRALGITGAKRKIAKATGIPTTKSGRKRHVWETETQKIKKPAPPGGKKIKELLSWDF